MNITLHIDGAPITLEDISRKSGNLSFALNGKTYQFRSHLLPDGSFVLEQEIENGMWQRVEVLTWRDTKNMCYVQSGGIEAKITELSAGATQVSEEAALSPSAPMPGVIRQIMVEQGQSVKQGDALVVMEAMKLQTTLCAGADAVVDEVLVAVDDMVTEGDELVRLTATDKEKAA